MSESLRQFFETWRREELAAEVAPALTCKEAEAIAFLFRSYGMADAADTWIECHAENDYPGDDHYKGDDAS